MAAAVAYWLPAYVQYRLGTLLDVFRGTVPSYVLQLGKRCTDSPLHCAAHDDFIVPKTDGSLTASTTQSVDCAPI